MLDLPATSPGDADYEGPTHEAWMVVFRRYATVPVQYYATREPEDFADSELLVGDVHDDLADIWRDLREGLDAYAAGDFETASWLWSFTFRNHWGKHAAEALRVLVSVLHAG